MRTFDFSSWHSILTTLIGLAIFTLVGVGIRLIFMMTLQQRRERANRQINERLKTLIAAYKVLGGSFTGDLYVDPAHRRDKRRQQGDHTTTDEKLPMDLTVGSDRTRRIRDAVEGALSDILLLGTEDHIRLAARAASELVAGRPVHTHELVVSLRTFIREALDLAPLPADIDLPMQGATRPNSGGSRSGAGEKGGSQDRVVAGSGVGKGGEAGNGGVAIGTAVGGIECENPGDEPMPPGKE